jgi:hypothetical protein
MLYIVVHSPYTANDIPSSLERSAENTHTQAVHLPAAELGPQLVVDMLDLQMLCPNLQKI